MKIRVKSTFEFSCFWGCSEQLNRPVTHFPAMSQAMCPADPYCTQGFSSQSSPSPLPGRLFLQANYLPSGFAHRKHAQPLHEPSIWSCYSSVPELSAFGSECLYDGCIPGNPIPPATLDDLSNSTPSLPRHYDSCFPQVFPQTHYCHGRKRQLLSSHG